MTTNVQCNEGICLLKLGNELTIYNVAEYKQQLETGWQQNQELHLDLSDVLEIDSAGVQLLLWLKKTAGSLKLVHHSKAVIEVFELLNLTAHFGDPIILTQ
ncbi:STAS domain-containing protein [Methylocucumis oryzae]|uniref:STAS domain-containing protein n=1 Tax=Methylocucumis oryzae TaxID=1632867 RepID=A0A0F3IL23_9GAMM|nr:STAS domain-containing protein [Methylocucumis oryzae]KJV07223.1 hypothetical protein VZ94_06180 [Methylocucumis oryzae]